MKVSCPLEATAARKLVGAGNAVFVSPFQPSVWSFCVLCHSLICGIKSGHFHLLPARQLLHAAIMGRLLDFVG